MNSDIKPFLFTFFAVNEIKLHITDSTRADEFNARHAGKMLPPPINLGPESIEEIGEFGYHYYLVETWLKSWTGNVTP